MVYKENNQFSNFEVYSITEQVADHLKQTIIYGDMKEGDKLPSENEMAEMFMVSRQTIRDALKLLSCTNLISTKPGRRGGHYVSVITEDAIKHSFGDYLNLSLTLKGTTLKEVIEMRKIIEVKASYLAALRRTAEDLRQIKEKIIFLKNETLSDLLFYKNDYKLHRSISMATKNRLIILSLDAISHTLAPLFKYMECPPSLKEELIHELESIYNSIYNKEPENAAQKMSIHLQHFEIFFKEKTNEK